MADIDVEVKNDKEQLDAPEHRFDDDEEEDEIIPDETEPAQQNVDDDGETAKETTNANELSTDAPKPTDEEKEEDGIVMSSAFHSTQFTSRFERIIEDSTTSAKEAKLWLDRVLTDGPRAVADILAIVVSPAVVPASADAAANLLDQRTVMANEPGKSVRELCEALEDTSRSAEGILVTSRKMRGHFQHFWLRVAADSSDAILYDTDCFDTLLTWLEAMSTAKLSIMRHAACIAAYSIVDGLIASGGKLRARLVTLQRQLATEKRKCEKKKKKGTPVVWSERYKRVAKEVDEAAANNGELVELADKVFTGVFVLKYRDVAAEIRVASVEFLGKWIMRYPNHYLDDTHTKYIGWLLSDKDPHVRRACLAALAEMLKEPDFFPPLELFLRRFLSRIVEMCNDRDNDVSVRAIRVCALLVPFDILDQEATDNLCDLLHEDGSAAVRKAAGEFVVAFITEPEDDTPAPKKTVGKSKKKPTLNEGIPDLDIATDLLRELVDVCVKDGNSDPDATLVRDAVWEVMPALRSWQAYAALLEDDGENAIVEEHKALLCELLVASAKQVVVEEPTPRKTGKKNVGESCKDALARIFTPLIPKLLVQYQGSSRILAALVQIPKHFSDVHFTEAATKKHFLELLNRLVEAISRHTGSKNVLDAAVGTFKTMLNEEHPLNLLANEALAKASKEAAKELRVLVASGIEEKGAVAVGAAVLKASVISNLKALPEGALDDMLTILDTVLENQLPVEFNTDVVTDACHVAVRQWIWDMLRVVSLYMDEKKNDDDDDDEEVEEEDTERKEMVEKLDKTLNEIQKRLSKFAEYPFNLRVRVASVQSICSMLCVHANMKLKNMKKDDGDTEMKDVENENEEQVSITDTCFSAVKECVLDLIVEQWALPLRHPRVSTRYESKPVKDRMVPEHEVSALCTALTQVCLLESCVPERFLHLPFLAFLLNRQRGTQQVESVCKFFMGRNLRLKQKVHDLVLDSFRSVTDVAGAQRERKHHMVSLLARALMEAMPKEKCSEFVSIVIKSLLDGCENALMEVDKASVAVSVLGKVNAFFAPRLDIDAAATLLVDCRAVKQKIKDAENLDEDERNQLGLLIFPVIQLLESVSSGEEPVIPTPLKMRKLPKPGSRGRGKTKRRISQKSFAGPKVQNTDGLRRSKRKRKPVKMDLYEEDSEEEEELVLDDEEEEEVEKEPKQVGKMEVDHEFEEEIPLQTTPRLRRTSKRKEQEDLDGMEEEVMPTPRSRAERMSARKEAAAGGKKEDSTSRSRKLTQSAEEEEESEEDVMATPRSRQKSASSKAQSDASGEVWGTPRSRMKSASTGKEQSDEEEEKDESVKAKPTRRSRRISTSSKATNDDEEEDATETVEDVKVLPMRRSRKKSGKEKTVEEEGDSEEVVDATPTRPSRKKSGPKKGTNDEVDVESTRTTRSRKKSGPKKGTDENQEVVATPTPRSRKKSDSKVSSSAADEDDGPPTVRSQKKRGRRKSSTGSGKLDMDEPVDEDGIDFEVSDERGLIMEGVDEAEVQEEEEASEPQSKTAGKSKNAAKTKVASAKKKASAKDDDDEDLFEKEADGGELSEGERDAPTSKETEAVDEEENEDDPFEETPAETAKIDAKVSKNGANGNGTKRRKRDESGELPDTPILRRKKQRKW